MKIKILGRLSNSKWNGGMDIREQDRVLGTDGVSKAIPSTYSLHPFKIMEIFYENGYNNMSELQG